MAEIVLEQVNKRFADGTEGLRPTDLTIRDGELFILVGPSGCGKSTLLKIIVGLERPTSGEVRVGGESVTERDPKDRNMAMVFQSYAIYPHMTVRENMAFPLKLAGVNNTEIAARVEEAATILELGELLERKPAALSGGQRQRVAMGRAIVRQPAAFLLDEPLSNLDAKLRVQMRTELARLQRRLGTTMVYVTHDQTEAMTLGHRIAVLRKGEIQQTGTPRELYGRPANLFVAGFVGSPAMNLLPAKIEENRLILPMSEVALPEDFSYSLPRGKREVIAGIRPENFCHANRSDAGVFKFQARLEVVEWLGADLFVHFDVRANTGGRLGALQRELELDAGHDGRLRVVARLGADIRAQEGETIDLSVERGDVHLFDSETGENITPVVS
ncbi:ABC transporter ATP-binding protein [Candidatus Thiosymbion oneisti]|uniref:ABC transporter ATP-binding protein n=1 Tax=Candidatus Thiosymbion oneisti TaxID=589554 RepID=UPI000A8A5230|nr:sn-glycerol-3-phosphate ABC transporter ATP-binding protein UgpC [Candidatus Thiosymbion oneisti]